MSRDLLTQHPQMLWRARLSLAVRASVVPVIALCAFSCRRDSDPARSPPEQLWFLRHHASSGFAVVTNDPLTNLTRVASVAEAAKAVTMALWDRQGEIISSKPLPIYLCASTRELASVESRFLGPADRGLERNDKGPIGGYYREAPMIAFYAAPSRTCELVCHEVTHYVVEGVCSSCPPIINEGMAMYVCDRVLSADPATVDQWTAQRAKWRLVCRQALRKEFGTLRNLFMVAQPAGWDARFDSAFYVYGWCLVRTMMKDRKRLADLISTMEAGDNAWAVLCRRYDVAALENDLRAEMVRFGDGN